MLRKLAVICAAATALIAFGAAPAAANVDDFVGQWTNQNADSSGVTRVSIQRRPAGARIRVYGRCHPTDCDWGEIDAVPFAPSPGGNAMNDATVLIARYDISLGRKTVIIRLNGANIAYEVFTDFNDARADYIESGRLRRVALPAPPIPLPRPGDGRPDFGGRPGGGGGGGGGSAALDEDCAGFSNADLRVVNVGGRWKIAEGSHWVADFGANRANADRGLEIIRRYGFASQCFVGRPNPGMTYWLRGNHTVPGGAPLAGEDCLTVNPANVRARNVGGAWKVTEGDNWLLDFGSNRASAEQAAQVIQTYNLNRQCFVARPNPPMSYWLSR